jgi:hypothetical protein
MRPVASRGRDLSARLATFAVTVSKNFRRRLARPRVRIRQTDGKPCGVRKLPAAPAACARSHRRRPCWQAAPVRCRCSRSPCRAGYAVRASAAPSSPGGPFKSTDWHQRHQPRQLVPIPRNSRLCLPHRHAGAVNDSRCRRQRQPENPSASAPANDLKNNQRADAPGFFKKWQLRGRRTPNVRQTR